MRRGRLHVFQTVQLLAEIGPLIKLVKLTASSEIPFRKGLFS